MSIQERALVEVEKLLIRPDGTLAGIRSDWFVAGAVWASRQEPSEAEVTAAAESLHPGLFTLSDRRYGIEFDNLPKDRPYHQEEAKDEARAALRAAREARS